MTQSFVLRAEHRGHDLMPSTGENASYVAGHPDAFITRASSFNFHQYQQGREGFGRMLRVFGDEVFTGPGCGYNMHPHHNFIICALVLQGELTHVNTTGKVDVLRDDDFYVFEAGSGGKHAELNIGDKPMHAIYIWMLPAHLMTPPSYQRRHYDRVECLNTLTEIIGTAEDSLPIRQDARVSRLVTDRPGSFTYKTRSPRHGAYAFVIEGGATVEGQHLGRRDSLGLWDADAMHIETAGTADLLIVESIL